MLRHELRSSGVRLALVKALQFSHPCPRFIPCYRPARPAFCAGVAKLVDAPDLGSGIERCGGSSPFARTNIVALSKASYFVRFPRV